MSVKFLSKKLCSVKFIMLISINPNIAHPINRDEMITFIRTANMDLLKENFNSFFKMHPRMIAFIHAETEVEIAKPT